MCYLGDPGLVCPSEVQQGGQAEVGEGVAHETGHPHTELPHMRPPSGGVWFQDRSAR